MVNSLVVVTEKCESDRLFFQRQEPQGNVSHISNLPPTVSVTCGHCALSIKKTTNGYLTREDAAISSDLFFAEVVKGKVIDRPVLTLMFGGGRIKNRCMAEFSTGGRIKNLPFSLITTVADGIVDLCHVLNIIVLPCHKSIS